LRCRQRRRRGPPEMRGAESVLHCFGSSISFTAGRFCGASAARVHPTEDGGLRGARKIFFVSTKIFVDIYEHLRIHSPT
jgi:hypothetical protein